MFIFLGITRLILALVAVGLPLIIANNLTQKNHFFIAVLANFISMLSAFLVCWCQYYSDVIWIKNADWSALQDVSESMAYILLGFIGVVIGANVWLLKRLNTP